jgi:hypothetical protein
MYNDNLRQIDRMNTSINNLTTDNSRIRNLLIRLLRNPRVNNNAIASTNAARAPNNAARAPNNAARGVNNERAVPINTTLPTNTLGSSSGSGRLFVNNAPYIIDNFQQYRVPSAGGAARNPFYETLRSFYEPVNVFPTQAQIATATRIVRYSDIGAPMNRSCPISIVDFNDSDMVTIIRNCGHIFHTTELQTWFTTHCTCPVCRFDIREARNNSSNNNDMPSASENITRASENITSAADNIIRATEDIARATDNIIGEAERQEERNTTSTSGETRATYSMTEIFDGLLNAFDIQDVEIMISDLSNNLISTPNPHTLFSLVSRFNNNRTP